MHGLEIQDKVYRMQFFVGRQGKKGCNWPFAAITIHATQWWTVRQNSQEKMIDRSRAPIKRWIIEPQHIFVDLVFTRIRAMDQTNNSRPCPLSQQCRRGGILKRRKM